MAGLLVAAYEKTSSVVLYKTGAEPKRFAMLRRPSRSNLRNVGKKVRDTFVVIQIEVEIWVGLFAVVNITYGTCKC